MSVPRNISSANGGWFWAENALLDRIVAENPRDGRNLIAAYISLCRIASEESKSAGRQVATFRAGFGLIAATIGCSRRAIIDWIAKLEDGGYIVVERVPQKKTNADDRVPNQYTLLPLWAVEQKRRIASANEGEGVVHGMH